MNGHQMVYESSFETPLMKTINLKLNINNDSAVASKSAFGRTKMSTIQESELNENNLKFKDKLNKLCTSFISRRQVLRDDL